MSGRGAVGTSGSGAVGASRPSATDRAGASGAGTGAAGSAGVATAGTGATAGSQSAGMPVADAGTDGMSAGAAGTAAGTAGAAAGPGFPPITDLGISTAPYAGRIQIVVTGRLRWQLMSDASLKPMFVGDQCTVCRDSNWTAMQKALM